MFGVQYPPVVSSWYADLEPRYLITSAGLMLTDKPRFVLRFGRRIFGSNADSSPERPCAKGRKKLTACAC
jgi:hypothetical protein